MSEKPVYHCGALDCCEGSMYPDCQAPHVEPSGTHYDDAQSASSPHHYTD